jgi:serine/threonine protein kinase
VTADLPQQAVQASRYELLHQLGEGGVGKVFVALDRETGEQVALKKLTRMSPLHVLRFKREFRALADIHHRNLVKLYELEHAEDGWFLTMELVEGASLLRGLDDQQLPRVIDAFHQLAQGVHAIHQAGMLHRDLKPSNVMLDRQGRVVVLDFGLVRELAAANDLVTLQGTASGTPAYMPPEQASAEELSAASDWYAFGVMLYEALSGMLPFDGRNPAELIGRKLRLDAPPVPEDAAPEALRELCARLLLRDPQQRPAALEILAALARDVEPQLVTVTSELNSLPPQTLTGHSSAELFGRDAERLQLEDALTCCIREHISVAVHVRGPSGAGKSSLVQSFISDSVPLAIGAAADPLVLRSRCYEREAMPFKSIDGAVDALVTHLLKLDDLQVAHLLPQEISALSALFPVFERVPAVQQLMASSNKRQKEANALNTRRRAEEGFRSLLDSLAQIQPVVIWIDDLQWGDLDSTQVLHDWLKRPLDAPVLMVLSYRSDEVATSTSLSALLSAAAKSAQLVRQYELDLRPLKDSDVYALCSKRLDTTSSLPPAVIARIVRGAQGNPFLATQLSALARAKLARGEEDLTALSVNELVLHTSALLPLPAQQLLQVLAVAGRPLAPRVALQVAEVSSEQRAHIHELQALRLVRTRYVAGASLLEVYHDRVRESVQAALSEAERMRIQRALLRSALADRRNDLGWLHELAFGAGERATARHYGMLAAEAASASLAFERAAELYERCLQLTDAGDKSAQLWKELALARVRCRRGALAADAYLEASALAEPSERVALLKLAASHMLRSGRFEEGERLVKQVLAELKISVPESTGGLYAAIGWERTRIAVLERLVRPHPGAKVPKDALQLGTLYGYLALDTQCYEPLRATLFQMRATRICFQYGEAETTARAYCMNAALSALSADNAATKRVEAMLARAQALIEDSAPPAVKLELYTARAMCAMLLGRLADAIEPARSAEALYASNSASGELGDYFYMFVVRSAWLSALQFLGRHREAAEVVRKVLEDAEATSNRCAVLQITLVRTGIEQVESSCSDSRARLDLERSELPKTTTSVLHLLHTVAVLRAACMTAEYAWAAEVYDKLWPKLQASPLQRSAYLMYLLHSIRARLLLNEHAATNSQSDPEPLVREHLHWLATKAPLPFRKPAPARLQARLAALSGKCERAAQLLELSCAAHTEIGAVDEAERDRYALGLLQAGAGGAALIESAVAALHSMGVREPQREIRAYYPELVHGT